MSNRQKIHYQVDDKIEDEKAAVGNLEWTREQMTMPNDNFKKCDTVFS